MRWIGCLLITIGSITFGLRLVYGNRMRLQDLRQCILALQYIAQEIVYQKNDLIRIFGDTSIHLEGIWKEGFINLQKEFELQRTNSLSEMWKNAFGILISQSFLSYDERKRWLELGHCFGSTNANNQAAMLADTTHYLERQYERLENEIPGRNRTLLSVSFITGILILLYFI